MVAVLAGVVSGARIDTQGDPQSTKKLSRLERLDAWVSAANRHAPGELDDAIAQVNEWNSRELSWVWIDLASLVTLVRDPTVRIFYAPAPRVSNQVRPGQTQYNRRPQQVFYTGRELKRLLEMAAPLRAPNGGRENWLLKRGAMLHADIAMLAPEERAAGSTVGPVRHRLSMDDGRPGGVETTVGHWEMGRQVLDRVSVRDETDRAPRGPGSDEEVRVWYVGTMSYMIAVGELDPSHFASAREIFPKDPDVLFLNAALHETLAGPRRQSAIRAANVAFINSLVGSRNAELGSAERMYRQALEGAPDLDEARIRFGRVLGQRGKHAEAVTALQSVSPKPELLQYYAALFLAGELEALGRDEEAMAAYGRAAALFPAAQSPRLGLSRLTTGADRASARNALLTLVSQPVDADLRDDPWWVYDEAAGRGADVILARLHETLMKAGK